MDMASNVLKSTVKRAKAKGKIGMINPGQKANFLFSINNTPNAKYIIPKARAATKLGSEGPLVTKYRCKMPSSKNKAAAR